jgi:nucleoside-diphosphate-sugar epimerase
MDFYSVTKCQAELTVGYFAEHFSTVILRYWYPYGLGTPNPLHELVRRVIKGEPVTVLRSGKPRLNPLHVDDAVQATVKSLGLSGHHILNVAGLEESSFRDIAERCARIHGGPDAEPCLEFIDDARAHPFHRRDALARIDRIQSLLDWRPSIALDDGLADFVAEVQAEEQI